jgi:YidC/Oxa1 family membrane protein insertase
VRALGRGGIQNMLGQIFDLLVVNPMMNLLLLLYGWLGQSYVLAIVVLTVLIRLITLPLTFQQQVSAAKTAAMQPKMKALQEQYKGDPQKLNAELRKIGFSPLNGCLPTLIQFPILIGMYQAIVRTLALTPLSLLEMGKHVYGFLPNLSQLVPIKGTFLGFLDLGSANHAASFFVIPVLVVITTFFSSKAMQAPVADPTMAQTNQMMTFTMPLMIGFFSLQTPIGLGIYWIVSNLIGVVQYFLTKPRMDAMKAKIAAQAGSMPAGDGSTIGGYSANSTSPARPLAAPPRSKVKVKSTGRVNRTGTGDLNKK